MKSDLGTMSKEQLRKYVIGHPNDNSNSHYENDSHESIALQCLKPLFYR